jgi:hypothetical protein
MMREFFQRYPYLTACLFGMTALLAVLAGCPGLRRPAIWSGALSTPFALSAVWLVPAYWQPRHVWSVGRVGLEDAVFSFLVGGWAWRLAAWPWRCRLAIQIHPVPVLAMYAGLLVPGLACFAGAWRLLGDPMAAVLLAFACGAAVFGVVRPGSWRLLSSGTVGFGLAYPLATKSCLAGRPPFTAFGPAGNPWSGQVWGIPAGEIAWALGYGACWPRFMANVFRAEWKEAYS